MIKLRIPALIISSEILYLDMCCENEKKKKAKEKKRFLEQLALRSCITSCLRFYTCQQLVGQNSYLLYEVNMFTVFLVY